MNSTIGWVIVIFNKFVIGKVMHLITDTEKISTFTQFNISFAVKLSICLFLNTAIISFITDIIILNNIIGEGGFISNESQVFILNALFPPLVFFIDPWSIWTNFKLKKALQKRKFNVLTQKQANLIAENPDYLSAKRYGDVMKTMWFTFFYGAMIPIGLIFSMLGIILYYYVDKFNILYRRTMKERIGPELS